MKNQPKQRIRQCHTRDTTPGAALTSRAAKVSAILAAAIFLFAAGCGSVPVPMYIGTDKEVARAACVPQWIQAEGFDLIWTAMTISRDRGIDGGELFLAFTDTCYDTCYDPACTTCYDPACTQPCMICRGALVRAAYGLE